MHTENLQTACIVRSIYGDLTVKTTRTHQSGVENVRAVGGRDNDDSCVPLETIHLSEQLIERLFSLIVTTTHTGSTLTTDRIDLVDEHDAGSIFLGLLEKIADAARTNSDEHLHKFGTGDREERNIGLAGYSFGQQSLAGAWRANQQNTFGDLGSDSREAVRVLEKINHLGELQLGAFDAGNIPEGDLG